jgi:putative restriction endonuclease
LNGAGSLLQGNRADPTVLVACESGLPVFAGFDIQRHQNFSTGSPSVQIDISTLREALQHGLAFDRKSNDEIAVGVRPDLFMTYALNAEAIHRYGAEAKVLNLLATASSLGSITEEALAVLQPGRRRIVQTISRMSRLGSFRQQVVNAYGSRCAVTRMQLRLVDAAHILPVGAPGSVDDVRNGLTLSPTYHRAYDHGLIYLDESYFMRINPEKEAALVASHLDGGLAGFIASLGKIHLPQDRRQWPEVAFIRRANQHRRIPA